MINWLISWGILTLIIILILPTILLPYLSYKNFFELVNGVPVSHITKHEYEAAKWLKDHVDVSKSPNSYIVSDHATSHIIRGMTGLNTTAGRHPNIGIEEWRNVQYTIKTMFSQMNSDIVSPVINSIKNDTQANEIYIVLSKRTCWWAAQPNTETIRFMPLSSAYVWENYCFLIDEKLQDVLGIDVIFRNKDVAIYAYNQFKNS